MRRPIGIVVALAGIAAAATFVTAGLAQNPECETFDATQPQPGAPDVKLLYTWDPACQADPALGPVKRDNVAIELTWSHDTASTPHAHEAWDTVVPTGVHTYKLTVTPDGASSYELSKSLLVSGTSGTDTDPDTDPDTDEDTDTGTDGDADTDSEDGPKVGGSDSSGCSAAPRGPFRGLGSRLLALI
jgi:hypothetical protein